MDNNEPVKATTPELVFHYTNQVGLLGIIRTLKIWATDILYLNDTAEMRYAFDLFESELKSMSESESSEYTDYLKWIHEISAHLGLNTLRTYVACFAEDGDKLSQWRGYCHGEFGFSLGFNFSKLDFEMYEQRFQPAKCAYQLSQQRSAIQGLIQRTTTTLRGIEASKGGPVQFRTEAPTIWVQAASDFLDMAAQFKHPKFSEEEEWRLIALPGTLHRKRCFRPGKSMIVPYVEFDLGDDKGLPALEKVYVGPSPFPDQSKQSVESLLRGKGIKHVEVACSSIPYRTW